jgi:hypothetical protein
VANPYWKWPIIFWNNTNSERHIARILAFYVLVICTSYKSSEELRMTLWKGAHIPPIAAIDKNEESTVMLIIMQPIKSCQHENPNPEAKSQDRKPVDTMCGCRTNFKNRLQLPTP